MLLLKPIRTVFFPLFLLLFSLTEGTGLVEAYQPGKSMAVREVRAVWLTTVGALDWPSGTETSSQRTSLAGMIERLARSGFNTIFFQVRGRGDAVYRSAIEPWSHVMTGTAGADPGWDPLAFVVSEAHARGMEVHAWFNTYFVRGLKSLPLPTTPPHVVNAHRDWVRLRDNEWWLDPGHPEVEGYLVRVATDIATRYDIDGLQLDYIRYPGRSFDDVATYKKYGRGVPLDRWRRENITRLIAKIKNALADEAPAVKLGVTPIGIYQNPAGVRGLESFSDVFQDSYDWVRSGIVDYVVPQLYWPVGGGGGNPDFASMVVEWRKECRGRHLYAGIGSYKPEVLDQGTRPVEIARAAGADGEAFFRYGSIAGSLPLGDVFSRLALPPPMPWKDNSVPAPPESVRLTTVENEAHRITRIRWNIPASSRKCRFLAVYRTEPGEEGAAGGERLVAVLPPALGEYSDTTAPRAGKRSEYAVSLVSRSGIESLPVTAIPDIPIAVANTRPPGPITSGETVTGAVLRVGVPSRARGSSTYFLPFSLTTRGTVAIVITDPGSTELLRVFEGERSAGGHVVSMDLSGFGAGLYRCTVRSGRERSVRDILIRK